MTARELVRRWRRRTACLAAALCATIATTIPFLNGYFLHGYWDEVGKYILVAAMVLLVATVGAAAYTYSFWTYARQLARLKAPDGSREKKD